MSVVGHVVSKYFPTVHSLSFHPFNRFFLSLPYLFIWLCQVLVAALSFRCGAQASLFVVRGLLSSCGTQALECTSSVAVVHKLHCACKILGASQVALVVENPPAMQEA